MWGVARVGGGRLEWLSLPVDVHSRNPNGSATTVGTSAVMRPVQAFSGWPDGLSRSIRRCYGAAGNRERGVQGCIG